MIRIARTLPGRFSLNRTLKYFETKTGFQLTEWGLFLPRHMNILAVLETPNGSLLMPAANIVTDAGDTYYAERGAAQAPGTMFGSHALGTGATAPFAKSGAPSLYGNLTGAIAGSIKATDASYPRTADPDTDNTGAGAKVTTWRCSYGKLDFSSVTPITHGLVTIATGNPNTVGSPVSGSALLTGYQFAASFTKSTDDTLKLFINHTFLGS